MIKLRLDQALASLIICPDPYNLQPSLPQQCPPFLLSALLDGSQGHHDPIHGSNRPRGSEIGDDEFIDEELGVAALHGRGDVLEDLQARGVVPVVQTRVDVVCSGACYRPSAQQVQGDQYSVFTFDGLRGEEVVGCQLDARRGFANLSNNGRLVLELFKVMT